MPQLESKFGGIITIARETYEERATLIRVVDKGRADFASIYARTGAKEDKDLNFQLYSKQKELQVHPLSTKVRIFNTEIPFVSRFLGSLFFETRWFAKNDTSGHIPFWDSFAVVLRNF